MVSPPLFLITTARSSNGDRHRGRSRSRSRSGNFFLVQLLELLLQRCSRILAAAILGNSLHDTMPLFGLEFLFNFLLDAQEASFLYGLTRLVYQYVRGGKISEVLNSKVKESKRTSSSLIPVKFAFMVVYLILSVEAATFMPVLSTKFLLISDHAFLSSSRRRRIMRSSAPAAASEVGIGGRVAREGVVGAAPFAGSAPLVGVDSSASSVPAVPSFLPLAFLFGVVVALPVGLRVRLRGVGVSLALLPLLLPLVVFSALPLPFPGVEVAFS